MEQTLQQMVTCFDTMFIPQGFDRSNPFVVELLSGNPGDATIYNIVLSKKEPHQVPLPLNAVWFNYQSNSKYYLQALQLVGYQGVISTSSINPALHQSDVIPDEGYVNCWVALTKYSELYQYQNIFHNAMGPMGPVGPAVDYTTIIANALAMLAL